MQSLLRRVHVRHAGVKKNTSKMRCKQTYSKQKSFLVLFFFSTQKSNASTIEKIVLENVLKPEEICRWMFFFGNVLINLIFYHGSWNIFATVSKPVDASTLRPSYTCLCLWFSHLVLVIRIEQSHDRWKWNKSNSIPKSQFYGITKQKRTWDSLTRSHTQSLSLT